MTKTELAIHCTDTPADMDVGIADIYKWHVIENGWDAVGYAHHVKRNGVIQKGRDLDNDGEVWDEIGAHVAGFNRNSIGISLAGGRGPNGQPQFNYTPAQMKSLKFLIDEYETRFPGIKLKGHCDYPDVTKACPVFDVNLWRQSCI